MTTCYNGTGTGMRRSELLSLTQITSIYKKVPLFCWIPRMGTAGPFHYHQKAIATIIKLNSKSKVLFPVSDNAIRLSWGKLRKRSGLKDIRFHDLRHEAISSFFERGLNIAEVALISGHKDPRMLMRYTHLKAEDIARKLN